MIDVQTQEKKNPYWWAGWEHDKVPMIWEAIEDLVWKALDGTTGWRAEDVLREARLQNVQVWTFAKDLGKVEGILLTQIVDEPADSHLFVLGIAGNDFDCYYQFFDDILKPWMHARRLEVIKSASSPEMERKLRKLGWRRERVLMRLEVPYGRQ